MSSSKSYVLAEYLNEARKLKGDWMNGSYSHLIKTVHSKFNIADETQIDIKVYDKNTNKYFTIDPDDMHEIQPAGLIKITKSPIQTKIETKTAAPVTLSKEEENAFRREWKVHSKVELYSDTMSKWIKGQIIGIVNDSEGEWLIIRYLQNREKEIQRFSKFIRPINIIKSGQTAAQENKKEKTSSIDNKNQRKDDNKKEKEHKTFAISQCPEAKKDETVEVKNVSQRRLARRRNLAKTALRTSQNVYYKLMLDKDLEFDANKDVIVGYNDCNCKNGDCEIALSLFKPNDELCHISFDQIEYYRTNNKILWNNKLRIDMLFKSGNTKLKLKQNADIFDISFANYNNLPPFVKKLLFMDKIHTQLTDLLLGLQLKMTSLMIQNNIKFESKIDDNHMKYNAYAVPVSDKNKLNIYNAETTATLGAGERYTHFLSIRINNPLLTILGIQLQNDIVDEYRKHDVEIRTSLIKANKFHISMNVLSLQTNKDVDKFCKKLKLLDRWLKAFIFDKNKDDKHDHDKNVLIGDDGVFMDMIEKYNYLNKLKGIYNEIAVSQQQTRLFLEGANHFNQKVIFLDFENQCIVPSNMNIDYEKESKTKMKWKPSKQGKIVKQQTNKGIRNELTVKLIQTFYELINNLCKTYNFVTNSDDLFIPHCTIMKLSKLKRFEMNKFMKYNKMNKIKLMSGHNVLGANKKRRRERVSKVYDFNILSATLNNENVENKIASIMNDKEMKLFQDIIQIDFCAMLGSHLTKDGYYNIIHSLPIAT